MAIKNETAINTINMLAIDMLNKTGNNSFTSIFRQAPILYALYLNRLNVLPQNPTWLNRDRFIIDNSENSALLYSLLHLSGYDYSIEDLKRYCEVDSYTPAYPVLNTSLGIENIASCPGQGIANAVGIALAQRYYESICKSVNKKSNLIDFNTYVLCNESAMQSGISYEALAFAAKQKLSKLIILLELTGKQNDGIIDDTSYEDIETRFEALDLDVIYVKNGKSISEITSALKSAKKSDMPTVIIIDNQNFKDDYTKLSYADIITLKQKYKLPIDPFEYKNEVKDYITNTILDRVNNKYQSWLKEFNEAKESRNKDLIDIINLLSKSEFYVDFDSTNYQINDKYYEEPYISNGKMLNIIVPKTKFIVGGSADEAIFTYTKLLKSGLMQNDNPSGRNIAFGSRTQAMGDILNGMALCGLRTYASTRLINAGLLKPALRLSSIAKLPITYIFTHDSIYSSEQGIAFEPIEQLTMLRSIPNMTVFRPADINEIIGAWEYILKNKGPVSIVLSTQKLPKLKHTNGKYVQYGAYIVRKEKYHLDGIIIATGSEVAIAIKISEELYTSGIDLRVVSMPSLELFLKQKSIYEEKLLPKDIKTITLEAGSTMLWHRFASSKECAIGIDTFGTCGKSNDVLKYAEFDYNSLLIKIKNMFE